MTTSRGANQGAGKDRPFDHKAPDDVFRIDTKTQQHGVLDVKQEKPGKQFTAWERSGKRFLPVQLVLDGKTNSWYVVPGIPSKTLGLDPLAVAFDPAEPLAPWTTSWTDRYSWRSGRGCRLRSPASHKRRRPS